MHVAYIHQHFSTRKGSTTTRSYEMGQRLLGAGHRVSLITGVSDVGDLALPREGGVIEREVDGLHVYCIAQRYSNSMGFTQRVAAFLGFARTAARVVSGLAADLVFATSTPLTVGLPGMKGARRLGVPFVFEVRDLWPELPIAMGIIRSPMLKWYTRRLERRIYRAARHIIALAPGIAEGIRRTGYPPRQISMIPNGSDIDLFRPSGEALTDPRFGSSDEFRLVFTGAHGIANGLDAVLDAAVELKRRGVRGIRFVFIGQGGQKPRLVERSQREGLQDIVTWCGSIPKDELAQVLPGLNVGMMILKNIPAFYFGTSPNKFFDYIASGMPVLNNYPGWLANLIQEQRCGLVVPPDDPRAFADAVLWLRDHPQECRAMGARGRALAEAQFARDLLADQFVRVLESVRAGRAAPAPAAI